MKKVSLVVALLLLATTVYASDVTITATTVGSMNTSEPNYLQKVNIGFDIGDADGNLISAFALKLSVDNGANLDHIADFNRGESKVRGGGYGIFPGQFRDHIQVLSGTDVNANPPYYGWADGNYTPLAPTADPCAAGTGQDNPTMIVELGSLYQEPNKPVAEGGKGTLFSVDVNMEGKSTTTLTVSAEPTRGGIVKLQGATGASSNLPITLVINAPISCTTVPNVVNTAEATATAAITAAGYTVGTRTTAVSCTIASGNVISTNPAAGASPGCGTPVAYVVSTGPGAAPAAPASVTVPASSSNGTYAVTWSSVSGAASYQLDSSAPASGTTIFPTWVQVYSGTATTYTEKVGGGTWSYRARALNSCGVASGNTTGGTNCVVYNCLTGGVAGTAENPDWVKWRYPACWCYKKHCRGDVNGKKTITYVASNDFTAFNAGFNKSDAQLIAVAGGICGDVNHKKTISRVASNDFTIFNTYFTKADSLVPDCNAAPVNTGPWTYWTTP